MALSDIREAFLGFFERNAHTRVKSSSLVPQNDPTLLFTNAGMVQFKDVFIGKEKRSYTRATSSQKCVRAGGKHNDLENVGFTGRHHTFFEMLGNFSFGDYFKEEACKFAWDFVTHDLSLSAERLYFTVFRDDEEAIRIWKKIGAPENRIFRMDEKDNFWAMGETGPCGPCSEIIFDQGAGVGCGKPGCDVRCSCDRHLEIWNLVFMQFERDSHGSMKPLPKPSIDTGMGLERVAAVLAGVHSNYDTYLFRPIIEAISDLSQTSTQNTASATSIRVIADHIRAMAFLITDGVLPSNEGRGYVLRRIMRRAIRHGKLLGLGEPFLFRLFDAVNGVMGKAYPELGTHHDFVVSVIQNEEATFQSTLETGLALLEEAIHGLKGSKVIGGDVAFKLYDTYGFPLDLTQTIAAERHLTVDTESFEHLMDEQKELSRRSWKGSGDEAVADTYKSLQSEIPATQFVGYDTLSSEAKLLAIIKDGQRASILKEGESGELLFDRTPFYGEQGGQMGDSGLITRAGFKAEVLDTKKPVPTLVVHRAKALSGSISAGDQALLEVDAVRRQKIRAHHSLTHLLQAALCEFLGSHVKQAGSLVGPDYLRFDFSHFSAIDRPTLRKIEARVNEMIRRDLAVTTSLVNLDAAVKSGAKAFFGEKYDEEVRVVTMGDVSRELCGGTHLRSTGEAGLFKILHEQSVASGVRRITALSGEAALHHVYEEEDRLHTIAELLRCSVKEAGQKVERLLEREKEFERSARQSPAQGDIEKLLAAKTTIEGICLLHHVVEPDSPAARSDKDLRALSDQLRDRLKSGVVALTVKKDERATTLIAIRNTPVHAGQIAKEIATLLNGRGGGKDDVAQVGYSAAQIDAVGPALQKGIRNQVKK